MSRLESAKLRLTRASRRLEVAARARASGGMSDEAARTIGALESENTALRETARELAERLDRTIARLRAALDR